jgi:FixJ family two-component response regulator
MRATIVVEGSPDDLETLIQHLHSVTEAQITLRPVVFEPIIDWEAHPVLVQLTPVEREIVRRDLLLEPRRRIAEQLDLRAGTVTVYRRTIRLKLRGIPTEQLPAALRHWLTCFPGLPAQAQPPREDTSEG